jgi:glycosyltransferase involved in cell wall biosynthesis
LAAKVRENAYAKNKTTTVSNGVNCETFRDAKNRNDSDQTVIGFVGTLKPWHGVSVLLEAFALVHEQDHKVRLKIVGSGPEQQNLQDQLSALPVAVQESVEWLGAVKHREMSNVLATFDIAVAPYPELSDFYFSPLKVLEYMASGRAIVASRIGQIADLIDDGHSGSLVSPGCRIELAAALLELCNEPQLRNRLGSSAQKIASGRHSWLNVVDKILATTDLELQREMV